MLKLIGLTLILGSLMFGNQAQQSKQRKKEVIRIKKDIPTVYMTFERVGTRKPLKEGEGTEGVWLRLHNNTRWFIMLDMNDVPTEYGDAGLFYDVLLDGKVKYERQCHVCSSNRLSPGRSLIFSLPREDLGKGGAIRVRFSYGWENPDDASAGREPEHYVYFYTSALGRVE
jgi:hypothetical protein